MMTISNRRQNSTNQAAITVDHTQSLASFYEKNVDYRDTNEVYEGRESFNRKIHFYIGDITDFKVDAIVCSTQTDLSFVPYGLHKQVSRRAGTRYQEACRQVGQCEVGEAFITQGYDLHAKHVIHTAGPAPDTTLNYDERKQYLRKSYSSCLQLVKTSPDIRTVAFPCLGSGGAGIQIVDAVSIAMTTLREWMESGDNLTQVDRVILVMYDESQWTDYYLELFKTFPYGKDLTGIDLESLDCIEENNLKTYISQEDTPSNILCFRYKKSASNYITRHFQALVNTIHKNVCNRHEPIERYRNCAIISHTLPCEYKIIIYYGKESLTLEVQIIICHNNFDNSREILCLEVQTLVNDYLLRNLENVTRFKTYIRCNNSSWGNVDGMVSVQKLKARMSNHTTIHCRHRREAHTTHIVNISEMAEFWISQNQESLHSYHPQAGEHDEVSGESEDCVSLRSIASSTSSGSGGNVEQKHDNISQNTRDTQRHPVEHSDESQETTLSKLTNFAKSKIQVLTKSNKEATNTTKAREDRSTDYHPLEDSLLGNDQKIQSLNQATATRGSSAPESKTNYIKTQSPGTGSGQSNLTGSRRVSEGGEQSSDSAAGNEWHSFSSLETVPSGFDSFEIEPKRGRKFSESDQCKGEGNLDSLGATGGVSHINSAESYQRCYSSMTSLNDRALLQIARLIGSRDTQLGLELDLSYACIQRIKSENANDATMQAFCILKEWKIMQHGHGSLDMLTEAMANCSIDTSSLHIT